MYTTLNFQPRIKWLAGLLLSSVVIASALLVIHPVQAQDGGILRGVVPDQVFAITTLAGEDAVYHDYAVLTSGAPACDLSQPAETHICQTDLLALATQFAQLTAVEYVPALPPSVQWQTGGLVMTPVVLAAEIRQYDAQTDQARQWQIACSIVPDQPDMAVCAVIDRLDHFNYILVQSADLELVIAAVGA